MPFYKNNSMEHAAADLGLLIIERKLTKRKYGIDSPSLRALEHIIPIHEARALGELRTGDGFDRLYLLVIRADRA